MGSEHREQTIEELDVAETLAIQTLTNQLTSADPKVAKAAADSLVSIRLKGETNGKGGTPLVNINIGQVAEGLKAVKEIMNGGVEVIEGGK